jgi:hypothetical protein
MNPDAKPADTSRTATNAEKTLLRFNPNVTLFLLPTGKISTDKIQKASCGTGALR